MKKILALALLAFTVSVTPAFAADPMATSAAPAKAVNPQTNKMKECAEEYKAKGMPKNEYRSFMSVCLRKDYQLGSYVAGKSSTTTSAAPKAMAPAAVAAPAVTAPAMADDGKVNQREKMKLCNVTAKEKSLRGADRKTFMKECLSAPN